MANARNPELWHRGKIVYKKFIPDNIRFWELELGEKEGKRVQMLCREEEDDKSSSQLAFYFGVIIRKYCMPEEQFGGWEEHEIDTYLRNALTAYMKQVTVEGRTTTVQVVDDIRSYTKDQMSYYLEQVINYLDLHHEIKIDDTVLYKWNKYKK